MEIERINNFHLKQKHKNKEICDTILSNIREQEIYFEFSQKLKKQKTFFNKEVDLLEQKHRTQLTKAFKEGFDLELLANQLFPSSLQLNILKSGQKTE